MNPSRRTPGAKPKAAWCFRPELERWIFPPESQARLADLVDVVTPPLTAAEWENHASALAEVEIIIGSWDMPALTAKRLAQVPRLQVVLYAAGSVHGIVTDAFWRRGVVLSSAAAANAAPTATFAEAMIVLALKHTWFYLRERRTDWAYLKDTDSSGVHRATIGIIGWGRVGREVVRGLQRHEVNILLHDPTVSTEAAAQAGVTLATLDELFARCDVVSLHAPLRPETVGLIRGRHLQALKRHASFINTARGAIVRESELVHVLQSRPDLTAILDVTDPEPAPPDSPLRKLPNVVLTPHLAGARHREIELLGRVVLEELERFRAGEPLQWSLTEAAVAGQA
jgi:phosphoglycerate dehydrogenase-like enzyme